MAKFEYVQELKHAAFPTPNVNITDFDEESIFVVGCPFWQETLFYTKNGGVQPWKNDAQKACRKLTKQMTAILSAMETKFRAHEKPDFYLTQDALGIFLSVLFWSNQQPVRLDNLNEALSKLLIKPLNIEERLEYCLTRAHTFPGFKQLNELLLEQRKLIAKS